MFLEFPAYCGAISPRQQHLRSSWLRMNLVRSISGLVRHTSPCLNFQKGRRPGGRSI